MMTGIFCANCGAPNHIYKNCHHPITSFGIVCVRFVRCENDTGCMRPQYLMVQRKDSLSYGTFLRGKFRIESKAYIFELFQNMTENERNNIATMSFEELWKALWQITECNSYMREYEDAKIKFDLLRTGYTIKTDNEGDLFFNIDYVLANTKSLYNETEWGFPKGRRNINEDDFPCALREFTEETSIPSEEISVLFPNRYEEVFIGGNRLRYRHVYYVCLLTGDKYRNCKSIAPHTPLQMREINNVEWFSYDEVQAHIRPFNVERKEIFRRIHDNLFRYALSVLSKVA